LNLNFFCHVPAEEATSREEAWRARFEPYYLELGINPALPRDGIERTPFDASSCALVERLRPAVVSFHFGLPAPALLDRVKAAGCIVLSSATTVDEARWLEQRGCDIIIAQGYEAGGHRAMFLSDDLATQSGTFVLVPEIAAAVTVPVIAAGGIADGRGIAAALLLGASAVQLGTAFLLCPETALHPTHRAALTEPRGATTVTNVFSGRPARGLENRMTRDLGPMSPDAPVFPRAGRPSAPLRARAESEGSSDFTPLWAGQALRLSRAIPARDLTLRLVDEARGHLNEATSISW
jgi:nitronate monooxygenase